jgi:hypothetical protein
VNTLQSRLRRSPMNDLQTLSWRDLATDLRRDVLPATAATAATAVLAFGLIVVPRLVAWPVLLASVVAYAVRSRVQGIAAAVTASMLFMLVHGRPRFATVVSDAMTIRLSFALGVTGAVVAIVLDRVVLDRVVEDGPPSSG